MGRRPWCSCCGDKGPSYLSLKFKLAEIARELPGGTDSDIRNYWKTVIKKKLVSQNDKSPALTRAWDCKPNSAAAISATKVRAQRFEPALRDLNCKPQAKIP
ncbi:hypothetical protein WN943_021105 [Citrus x changshan-huyou]